MEIQSSGDDPIRTYSDQEQATLANNLLALTEQVKITDSQTEEYSIEMVCQWHARLFASVRSHAGKYRQADFGDEFLKFGKYHSARRRDVLQFLQAHYRSARNLLEQLDSLKNTSRPDQFVEQVLTAAFYLHAEFIRIHPFIDGNGRVGRLIITYCLARFGLPPLALEVPKQEYLQALNHNHDTGELQPLIDLALRLYRNQYNIG